jgi:hypothetical protein
MQRPFSRDRWKSEYWLVFAGYLLTPATLAIAVIVAVHPKTGPRPMPNTSAVWASHPLFVASLFLDAYWVYRMKGPRRFAVAVRLIALGTMLGAGFISGMALSGDWL